MKKSIVITTLLAALSGVSVNAFAAGGADVTLQGVITKTTCDVSVNNGNPTLNVGVFKTTEFNGSLTQIGETPLTVELKSCSADETGKLLVLGTTASAAPANTLFVNNVSDKTGFMLKDSGSVQVVNAAEKIDVTVKKATPTNYTFKVGMGSTVATPEPGIYTAPVTIAYLVR